MKTFKNEIVKADSRQVRLTEWVAFQLENRGMNISSPIQLIPLGGDAGFRRYFRFESPSRWLAVDAPPTTEDSRLFVQLAEELRSWNVQTPRILAVDFHDGWLLVEDLGDRLLFQEPKIQSTQSPHFYSASFRALTKLQLCKLQTALPTYDQALLYRELDIFCEWFVEKLLEHTLSDTEKAVIQKAFSLLANSALEQPQTLVHRDFHSRNLICLDGGQMGVLDFQGAVLGPCTYDLVSLLRDCYLRWPANDVVNWALEYRKLAQENGLLTLGTDSETYLRWFDWMGMQRHIKVLGIFARLHLRDKKSHYLRDLPLVIRYTMEISDKYGNFNDFSHILRDVLLPKAATQDWYTPWEIAGDNP